jgi:pimeloyl-ACP methyl ester carboxylesterase
MKRRGTVPPVRGPHGEPIPGSIAEAGYVRLGGVAQWVMIRGASAASPPLILLHGGPGLSESTLFRHHNAALERCFTVVHWDQRGAGKSFDPAAPRAALTVERLVDDLGELVEHVGARLGHARVVLLGHSWGSALGALYAARAPDQVAAYVGAAQIGSWPDAEAASYALTLAAAERRGHRTAIRQLRAIGAPPYGAAAVWVERRWALRFAGGMRPAALWSVARAVLATPEASLGGVVRGWRAFRASFAAMWDEVSTLDLIERVPALTMPVFFFVGRMDPWIPPQTSVDYFDRLSAPSKRLVWFEESGHEVFVDEAAKFNAIMTELVRPVVTVDRRRAA